MIIEKLFEEFCSAPSSASGECQRKLEIIDTVERHLIEDPLATEFLLNVAIDADEYDLARLQALKALAQAALPSPSRATVAGALARILREEQDDLVLQHATIAASQFTDDPVVLQAVRELLLDSAQGIDVRHNALFVLERHGDSVANRQTLQSVGSDPFVGPAARRLLQRWPAA